MVRLNVRIGAESRRRLAIHCAMTGEEPGKVVSDMLKATLVEWAMPVNLLERNENKSRRSKADSVSDSVAVGQSVLES